MRVDGVVTRYPPPPAIVLLIIVVVVWLGPVGALEPRAWYSEANIAASAVQRTQHHAVSELLAFEHPYKTSLSSNLSV